MIAFVKYVLVIVILFLMVLLANRDHEGVKVKVFNGCVMG